MNAAIDITYLRLSSTGIQALKSKGWRRIFDDSVFHVFHGYLDV